ncbi:Por secretion system C-terminal sorting domain-containing protein [Mesonia phycicola]|uniref:Por secretion system C-terminal sorting domain-containing protein n=1 Tax=Mesonia phycicola TaxID=579105 RepID=A0A1M6FDD9_9FLAO|nr:T9SS type A sorting domain-containing protein [Mesonia phycicola]SHI95665.1 Por secretion system C-terminal sorting domain-containing protein [Mesonia phycicola]
MKTSTTTSIFIGVFCYLFTMSVHAQTYQRATSVHTAINVDNSTNAIDLDFVDPRGNLSTYSTIKANSGLALGIGAYDGLQALEYPTIVPGGTTTYFKLGGNTTLLNNLLGSSDVGALLENVLFGFQTVTFSAYDASQNPVLVKSSNDIDSEEARVVSNAAGEYFLAFTPPLDYKYIQIHHDLTGTVGLLDETEIYLYGAFYTTSSTSCGGAEYTSWSANGGLLSVSLLGSGGVDNPENVIDNDLTTYSKLSLPTLSVAGSVEQTVYFDGASSSNYQINLASTADVVSLNLINNVDIIGYNGSTLVDSTSLSSLLDLDLLGLFQSNGIISIPYTPTSAIDRITIRMSSLANVSLTSSLRLYDVSKNPTELTTQAATAIHTDGATLNADMINIDCVTSYGFEYSTDPNFEPGSGTQIPVTNLASGSFSNDLTGLNAHETYYFRAYSTISSGTTYNIYGEVESFTTDFVTWNGSAWNNTTGPNTNGSDDVLVTGDYTSDIDGGGIAVDSLFINSGVVIELKNNDNIDLYGSIDATNDHSIDAKEGSVTLLGEATQVLDGNDFVDNTLNIIEVNKDVDTELDAYNEINIIDNFTITSGDLNLNNGANLVFKSSLNKTAIFGEVADCTNTTINYLGLAGSAGRVTVERFIKAKRAFRGLTAPVNCINPIKNNWQEGAQNLTSSYSNNQNPNPGYGTHITGSNIATTGFDVTATTNPSLFTYNNISQSWVSVTSTVTTTITPGSAYLLMVRGDRSINTEINNPTPTNTILRASGHLNICDFVFNPTSLSPVANNYNFIGNPYQSPVDMNLVLNDTESENVNTTSYQVYNPHLNTNGAYVIVDVTDGSSVPPSSVDQYLQPGQAAFIFTDSDGGIAKVTFKESHKTNTSTNDVIFRPSASNIDNSIRINLYKNSTELIDGVKLNLSNNFSFNKDNGDIYKSENFDETFALVNNSEDFAIVSEPAPNDSKVYPFSLINYRNSNYKFEVIIRDQNGLNFAIKDNYLNKIINLNDEVNLYEFNIDLNDDSSNSNRFELIVTNETLSNTNEDFLNFVVHPNPITENYFTIESSKLSGKDVNVAIYSILGKQVYKEDHRFDNKALKIEFNQSISSGVYLIKLNVEDETYTQKLIIK